jgi:hypothetical protein
MIHTLTQRHLLPVSTPATGLRRIGRIDFDELPASFFRFARQSLKKSCPRCIVNAFCETMIMNQTVDGQILYTEK